MDGLPSQLPIAVTHEQLVIAGIRAAARHYDLAIEHLPVFVPLRGATTRQNLSRRFGAA